MPARHISSQSFDEILSGEKTEEYQDFMAFQIEVSDFNVERIKLDLHEIISKLNEVKEKRET